MLIQAFRVEVAAFNGVCMPRPPGFCVLTPNQSGGLRWNSQAILLFIDHLKQHRLKFWRADDCLLHSQYELAKRRVDGGYPPLSSGVGAR